MDKKFVVKLTQSGITAPVATVIRNDLGAVPVWSHDSAGVYTATLVDAFAPFANVIVEESTLFTAVVNDDDSITLTATGGDGTLTDTPLELTVYDAAFVPVVPTGYCTQDDLEKRISVTRLAELTNDVMNATSPDANVVNAAIKKAETQIDSELAESYTVPFTLPAPEVINNLAVDLAVFYCFERKFSNVGVPDSWKDTKKRCDDLLEELAQLTKTIPGVDPTSHEGDIEAPDLARENNVDFNDQTNPYSRY